MPQSDRGHDDIDAWFQRFPREEAEARIRELERELARLRSAVALYDSAPSLNENGAKGKSQDAPASRPAGIRQILRERGNEPTLPGEIKEVMVERGWLDQSNTKFFYSAVSTMTKRGHLLRLQDGRYMLSSKSGGEMT